MVGVQHRSNDRRLDGPITPAAFGLRCHGPETSRQSPSAMRKPVDVRLMRFLRAIVFLGAALYFGVGAAAADLPYLSERLKDPVYNNTFSTLFRGKNVAPWLLGYLRDRDGVDIPGRILNVSGQQYELYWVCEPHNCGGSFIKILFLPGGKKAFVLFIDGENEHRFFGNPDQHERDILWTVAQQ
jgi:hypothetical protein